MKTEIKPAETTATLALSSSAPGKSAPKQMGTPEAWLQPNTFIDALLLICLFAFVCIWAIRPAGGMDEDLWWHIRTGNWILAHRTVPTGDVFAFYTIGKPWIDYSWLFDIFTTKVFSLFGMQGFVGLTAGLLCLFLAALIELLARYTTTRRAIGLAALVYLTIVPLVTPRPWLFTFVFFIGELHLLLRAREQGKASWLLPVLPLMALWANTHVQFVYGLALVGLFALERPLARLLKLGSSTKLSPHWFWMLLGGSLVSTLLNPYGWRLYDVVLEYAREKAPLQAVQEMLAPSFRSVSDWTGLLLFCWALFVVANSRKKSVLLLLFLATSAWFGFHSRRDTWYLAVFSALAIAAPTSRRDRVSWEARLPRWAISLPVIVLIAFGRLDSPDVSGPAMIRALNKRFPVAASAYVERQGLRGPLYNSYEWGGYLIWRLPKLPVSIDGRANVHGDVRVKQYADTWAGPRNWDHDPELMRANTVILERDSALASILRSDERFRLVYDDDVASIFQPARLAQSSSSGRR